MGIEISSMSYSKPKSVNSCSVSSANAFAEQVICPAIVPS